MDILRKLNMFSLTGFTGKIFTGNSLKAGVFLAILLFLLSTISIVSRAASQVQPSDQLADQVIARLNAWRLDQKVAPLKFNPTLRDMAVAQAMYIASLPDIPGGQDGGDIHYDEQHELPPQRAIHAPYNWPSYGRPDRTAIGEDSAVGTLDFAFFFWSTSAIHRTTALNPGYREVGAAVLPYKSSYLIFVDFGSRPNVLPALVSPDHKLIYITNEQYKWKNGGSWMQNATQIQLFDDQGQPFHSDPYVWTPSIALPDKASNTLRVVYINGGAQVTTVVNLEADLVWLPDNVAAAALTSTLAATATPMPTTVSASMTPMLLTAQPTTINSQVTAQSTPTAQVMTESAPIQGGLTIYYRETVLTLLNSSTKPVNLIKFNFKFGDTYLGATRWTKFYPTPITAIPAGQCLQIRLVSEDPAVPTVCKAVRSVLEFPPDRLFWMQGDFDITVDTTVVANCKLGAKICQVPWTN